jgi:hypothetical protein
MAFKDFKFTQRIRFTDADAGDLDYFNEYWFEIQNARVTFEENVRNAELIDGTLQQFVLWYRPVFQFSTPYLRRSGEGSYDFTDVIHALNNPARAVYVALPDIGGTDYHVVKRNDSYSVAIEEQFITSGFEFTVLGVQIVNELPGWFKFTRNSPKYML